MPHSQDYIAVTGTFDVKNYGDLLFPLIAAFKLGLSHDQIIPVSPTSIHTGLDDTIAPLSWNELMDVDLNLSGILVGGGNIIHDRPVNLPAYANAKVGNWAYESLWLGAAQAAKIHRCPLVLNAPGVPYKFTNTGKKYFSEFAETAQYLSVRDKSSREILANTGVQKPITVVPDTAFSLKEMWPESELRIAYMKMMERLKGSLEPEYIAIHVKERSIAHDVEAFAKTLDLFCRAKGLQPLLIGIGGCHGDDAIADKISVHLQVSHINLSRPEGLKEIAAAIAYIGASMHGYITARVYNRPAMMVAKPAQHKLLDLVDMLNSPVDLASSWRSAFETFEACRDHHGPINPDIYTALDTHWNKVTKVLDDYNGRVEIFSTSIRENYFYKSA